MALKAVLTADEFGALDEALQAHYTATADGKHVLDTNVDEHPGVQPLSAALKRFKEAAGTSDPRTLQRRLEDLNGLKEKWGERDPDEVQAALDELEALRKKGGDGVDVQQAVKDAIAATEKKLKPLLEEKDGAIAERDSFIHRLVVDRQLDAALAEAKIIEAYRPAVKAMLKERGPKVIQDGEDYLGVFSTELGDVSISDYVGKWAREKEAEAYLPASDNKGSGAGGGGGGGGHGRNPWKDETFNLTEQGRITKENPALAKQLAAAAGKQVA